MPATQASRKFFLLRWLDAHGFNVQRQLLFIQWTLPILLFLIVVSDEVYEYLFDHAPFWSQVFAVEVSLFGVIGPIGVWFTLGWIHEMWLEREQNHKALRQMYDELTSVQEHLRVMHTQRGELLNRLMNIQEEERRHLARELHDELGQLLTGLSLNLKVCQSDLPPNLEQAHRHLTKANALVYQTIEQTHSIIVGLRPTVLDDYGLLPALKEELHQRLDPLAIQVKIESAGDVVQLPVNIATTAFRITQEAITNVIRHAHAQRVVLYLSYQPGELIIEIVDDGVGIQPPSDSAPSRQHLGIVGMQERAAAVHGWLQVLPSQPTGTTIRFGLPVQPKDEITESRQLDTRFDQPAEAVDSSPIIANAYSYHQ